MRIAFASHAGLEGFTPSDQLAADELTRRGVTVTPVAWTAPADWPRFDAVVIRATWDYYKRPAEFLQWLRSLEQQRVSLWNPAPLAAWNMHKGYLQDLERAGVPVVPTAWISPASANGSLDQLIRERGWSDVVVKPAVSADANRTWRTGGAVTQGDEARFRDMVSAGEVMVQPVIESLLRDGEW